MALRQQPHTDTAKKMLANSYLLPQPFLDAIAIVPIVIMATMNIPDALAVFVSERLLFLCDISALHFLLFQRLNHFFVLFFITQDEM